MFPVAPQLVDFPKGSRADILSTQFAEVYGSLLNALHEVFNGHPDSMGDAIGIMFDLANVARDLMQTPSGVESAPGTTAGPKFKVKH